jgi:hypothetical protein
VGKHHSARRSGRGKAQYDVNLPQTTQTSPCIEKHAPKHHYGENSYIPQTQHAPHCTLQATPARDHRENPTTQQPTENTRMPHCCSPKLTSRQRAHINKDVEAAQHGELDSIAHIPSGTCWTCELPNSKLILQTRQGKETNPLPVDKNKEQKAQRL